MKNFISIMLTLAMLVCCFAGMLGCVREQDLLDVKLRDLCIGVGAPLPTANDFVISMPENCSIRMEQEYYFSQIGDYTLTLIVTDPFGKETKHNVSFSLVQDDEPPQIHGVTDISVYVGEGISYRSGIEVRDNCDGKLTLDVDTSSVDQNTEGVYPIVYTATDAVGNESRVEVFVYVYQERITEEQLFLLLDPIIRERIPTAGTREQQVREIYTYVYNHVAYDAYSDKSDWVRAAYDGLRSGKGDCFTYFALSKAFFVRLGIENMDIQRTGGIVDERHYWNMVNIGTAGDAKWYHFDACRLSGVQHNGCLLTDLQVQAYTKQRVDENGIGSYFYAYDSEKYPKSESTIITPTPSLEPYY